MSNQTPPRSYTPACKARRLATPLSAVFALLAPLSARAQSEAEKPAPNILLLVDTSGSMEFKTDGTLPTCTPGDPASTNEKSRWIDLVEVMTGTFDSYSCWAQDRSSADFQSEFTLGTVSPYDYGYNNPYHRALSNSCTYGPGVRPDTTSPYSWPANAVSTFEFTGAALNRPPLATMPAHPGCAGFSQADDGLLDIYKNMVRFGLMTFDTRINPGTGLSGTSADYATGVTGTWSYFLGSSATGRPEKCTFDLPQEIGARNAAAPPWEGRMIAFGPPDGSEDLTRNEQIQKVLLSTRPYGATPIAGQLDDARAFLWNDTNPDPLDPTRDFGPTNDPSWRAANCRKSIVILLTDGEPNLDLRPSCEQDPGPPDPAGVCPYDRPEEIVEALRTGSGAPSSALAVETYVIGFALGNVTPSGGSTVSCSELTDAQCADPNNNVEGEEESKRIQACCTLNEIAAAGGFDDAGQPRKAFFAENRTELRSIFTAILDDVVQLATRTSPVFSSSGGDTASKGFKFFSAFDPQPDPSGPQLWEGILQRKRFVCDVDSLTAQEVQDDSLGDDFGANLNTAVAGGTARWLYSSVASGDNRNTIRPYVYLDNDGLGISTSVDKSSTTLEGFADELPAAALQVTASSCNGTSTADECRDLIVDHAVGLTNAAGLGRCTDPDYCSLLGGIYHSTPQVVSGSPDALLRDDSYRAFVTEMADENKPRPSALYTSTVDGFLHAFKLAPHPGRSDLVNSVDNNELWAFVPPAVLPVLQVQYPSTPAILLDGVPVISDVVARQENTDTLFERVRDDAQAGNGLWRTVLVQAFGKGQVNGGYFALDITNPNRAADPPKFLWQLTRTSAGLPLFGEGGTPLITNVFVKPENEDPVEIAVAILPGGDGSSTTGASATTGPMMGVTDSAFVSTRNVRNYTGEEDARSLTIVRLDNGEVIKTFRPVNNHFDATVFTPTDIPSPIVGRPAAFPATTGTVAERVFVGDRDGRLWRLDLTSQDPDDWEMEIFFDAFWDGTETSGQPIELAPILSVDDAGSLTVAFATGDQEAATAPSTLVNRVVSLTEQLDASNDYVAKVNWVHELDNARRVTGPMVLFNRGLYYAASRPGDPSSAICDVGTSQIFGTHYLLDAAISADPTATPDPLSGPGPAPRATSIEFVPQTPGLIFGVSLDAEPTCASEAEVISGDEGFGYGEVRSSRTINPGRFMLSFEVSGSSDSPTGVKAGQQELTPPRVPVTFESLALIYE